MLNESGFSIFDEASISLVSLLLVLGGGVTSAYCQFNVINKPRKNINDMMT